MRVQEIDKRCAEINGKYGTHLERPIDEGAHVAIKDIPTGKNARGEQNYLHFYGYPNYIVGYQLDAFELGLKLGMEMAGKRKA